MPKLHTTMTVPVTIHFDVDIGERKTYDSPEVPLSITINDVSIEREAHIGNLAASEYNINTYALHPDIESELQELVQDNESDWQNE